MISVAFHLHESSARAATWSLLDPVENAIRLLAFSDTVQDCNERGVKTTMKGGGDGVRLFPISSNITTADSTRIVQRSLAP